MTLTAPNCLVAGSLPARSSAPSAPSRRRWRQTRSDVRSALVQDRMSEAAKLALGIEDSSHREAPPMKLSANEEYGLRCLVASATRARPEASRSRDEPRRMVSRLCAQDLRVLREGRFCQGRSAARGGYTLARPPESMSSPTSSAPWAAASSRANSATTIPARPHLHPFRGLLRAFPVARRANCVDQVLAKPLCATSCKTKKR